MLSWISGWYFAISLEQALLGRESNEKKEIWNG
jgi:hypothetical protein